MRQLAGSGHLPSPELVQDLAGLHVAARIVRAGLPVGQDPQRVARHVGHERQDLERGDEAVPPEERREPRDSGSEVVLTRPRPVVL